MWVTYCRRCEKVDRPIYKVIHLHIIWKTEKNCKKPLNTGNRTTDILSLKSRTPSKKILNIRSQSYVFNTTKLLLNHSQVKTVTSWEVKTSQVENSGTRLSFNYLKICKELRLNLLHITKIVFQLVYKCYCKRFRSHNHEATYAQEQRRNSAP